MIQLVTMLKRKPGTTHEEFLRYWREHHGPLITRLSSAKYVRRYEQHASIWPPDGSKLEEPMYDGVTIQWFDSADDFYAHVMEPDQAEMMADIAEFLDVSALHWTICEAPVIVIGDDATTTTATTATTGTAVPGGTAVPDATVSDDRGDQPT